MTDWTHTTRRDATGRPLHTTAGSAAESTMIAAGWVKGKPTSPERPAVEKPVVASPERPVVEKLANDLLAGEPLTNKQIDEIIDGKGLAVNKKAPLPVKTAKVVAILKGN